MATKRKIVTLFVCGAVACGAGWGVSLGLNSKTTTASAESITVSSDFTNGGAFELVERNGLFSKSNVAKDTGAGNADYGLIPASGWGDPVVTGDGSITYRLVADEGNGFFDLTLEYEAYLGCAQLDEYYNPDRTNVIVSLSEDNIDFTPVYNMHNGSSYKNIASAVCTQDLDTTNKFSVGDECFGNTSDVSKTTLRLGEYLDGYQGEIFVKFDFLQLTYDELDALVQEKREMTLEEYIPWAIDATNKKLNLSKTGVRVYNVNITAAQKQFDEGITDLYGDDFTAITLADSNAAATSNVSTDAAANAAYGLIPAASFTDPLTTATGTVIYKVDSTALEAFKNLRLRAEYLLKELPNADLLVYISDSLDGSYTKVFHAWEAFAGKAYRTTAQVAEIDLTEYALEKQSVYVKIELKHPTFTGEETVEDVSTRLLKTSFIQWADFVSVSVTNDSTKGTVTTNAVDGKLREGEKLVVKIAPIGNYYAQTVLVNGQQLPVVLGNAVLESVAKDVTVEVVYAEGTPTQGEGEYAYNYSADSWADGAFQTSNLSIVNNVDYKGNKMNAVTAAKTNSVGCVTYKYVAPAGKTFASGTAESYARLFDYYLKGQHERVEYYVSYDNVSFKPVYKSLINMDGGNAVTTVLDLDSHVFGRDCFYFTIVLGCSNDRTWTNMNYFKMSLSYEKTSVTVAYGDEGEQTLLLDRGTAFVLSDLVLPEGFVCLDETLTLYTDEACTQEYVVGTAVTKALKLYVKGEIPPRKYAITYVLNGGVNSEANPAEYIAEQLGTEALPSLAFVAPTREGYIFLYWCTDEACEQPFFGVGEGFEGDLTLYAKWIAVGATDFGA
ncbi:MAG: InlB B-repeat-containing protein [Clostridia bacterium]|nr:InlB B-repeat-containing protein [Clostridia bacterium]